MRLGLLSLRRWSRHSLVCVVLWATTALATAATGDKIYTVRRGDTLSGIAHTYGIPLAQLARQNKLRPSGSVRPGQRLVIPAIGSGQPPVPGTQNRTALPPSVQRAINSAEVQPGRWKNIVIHHSGVDTGTMAGMDRYHRETRHMENGLAYHFVIGNDHGLGDGEVGVSARWTKQLDGGHLISEAQNKVSLGICLVGNFDKSQPTVKQMDRLAALVRALMKRCNLSARAVTTHQQINIVHTRCPGKNFPLGTLNARIGGS